MKSDDLGEVWHFKGSIFESKTYLQEACSDCFTVCTCAQIDTFNISYKKCKGEYFSPNEVDTLSLLRKVIKFFVIP